MVSHSTAAGSASVTLIEEYIVPSGGAASKVFSSGISNYKTLKLEVMARSEKVAVFGNIGVRFNGDTGTNYSRHTTVVNNATVTSSALITQNHILQIGCPAASSPANAFGHATVEIQAPNSTEMHKRAMCLNATRNTDLAADQNTGRLSGEWRNTSAITSITVYEFDEVGGQDIAEGSIIRLWGMR
jgi:hypothetical protein